MVLFKAKLRYLSGGAGCLIVSIWLERKWGGACERVQGLDSGGCMWRTGRGPSRASLVSECAGGVGAGEMRRDVGDRLFQNMLRDVAAGQWEAWWQNGRLRPW